MAHIMVGLKVKERNRKIIQEQINYQEKELAGNRKPYKASKWCRDMTNTIKRQTDKDGRHNAGGAFLDQLHKKYKAKVQDHAKADLRKMGHNV